MRTLNSTEDRAKFLARLPVFAKLDKDGINSLAKAARCQEYEKGKILFLHGDPAENFYIIGEGWVKLFRETLDGQESITSLLTKGDTLGEAIMFDNATYPVSAQVVEKSFLMLIPATFLREQVKKGGNFAMQMLASISQNANQLGLKVEHLTAMNAPQRVGCFLIKLCLDQREGKVTVSLPYDKGLVANSLGMKSETFSRALQQLKEVGVSVHGSDVIIEDIAQLSDYTCVSCSYTEECDPESKTA